jgi:predicted SAM-dependent methyltransferase
MNWKWKARALMLLSKMPGGGNAYHHLQRWLGTTKLQLGEYLGRAIQVMELVKESGQNVIGSVVLEIGTGWRPFVPFLFYLAGAERILTLDVNSWLDKGYASETYLALGECLPEIADRLSLSQACVQTRYETVLPHLGRLADLLAACHVEYRCPADARRTGLPDQSVNIVCSSNVLEHVSPDFLHEFHRECFRVIMPSGATVHRVNPGDHFSVQDPTITTANFLQYSEERWRPYGGRGLAYHNRLRCIQHRRMLEEAGFSVIVDRVRIDQRALEAIQQRELLIDADFSEFTLEELAADYLWLVGVRALPSDRCAKKPASKFCVVPPGGTQS